MSARAAAVALLLAAAVACRREERRFEDTAAASRRAGPDARSGMVAGAAPPAAPGERAPPDVARGKAAEASAYDVNEGQRLFEWFNCTGCHGRGGGAIGPPLMDGTWIYGGTPRDVFESIAHGRPNGMPAFGGRLPEVQIWQLVAYVRALSAMVPLDVRPGRPDALSGAPVPSVRSPEPPHAPGERP